MTDIIATWRTRGLDYLQLIYSQTDDGEPFYKYRGNGCGGILPPEIKTAEAAIKWMEDNPVAVLKTDKPSLRRVFV